MRTPSILLLGVMTLSGGACVPQGRPTEAAHVPAPETAPAESDEAPTPTRPEEAAVQPDEGPPRAQPDEGSAASPTNPEPRRGHTGRLMAPVVATWSDATANLPTTSPTTLELVVTRRSLPETPLTATVQVPDGATLVAGDVQSSIPNAIGDHTVRWTIAYQSIPTEDVVVTVASRTEGYGYHAELRYTFGRPDEARPTPTPDGPTRTFRGVRFGPTIPVAPTPPEQ